MEALSGLLDSNPYFAAGAGLFGIGFVASAARKGSAIGYIWAKRRLILSVEIVSKDTSYQWFLKWMAANAKQTKHLAVQTNFVREQNGSSRSTFDFVPSVGNHWFKYKGSYIWCERVREKTSLDLQTGSLFESVTLSMLATQRNLLADLLLEAKQLAEEQESGATIIFTSFGPEWRQFGAPRRKRPLASVILQANLKETILSDLKEFITSASWYIERGIPYRRGYLLHGSPGCGKSSFIQALAAEVEYNICILSLSDGSLTDDRLNHLLVVAPEKSIILLEDIDAAFSDPNNQRKQSGYQNGVTFSGLLNALDGVAASEGRVLFMTTNHIEKLDPALIRPGRVDVIEELNKSSSQQIQSIFKRFYPTAQPQLSSKFATKIPENKYSMASLQGYCLLYKDKPLNAIDGIEKWMIEQDEAIAKSTIADVNT